MIVRDLIESYRTLRKDVRYPPSAVGTTGSVGTKFLALNKALAKSVARADQFIFKQLMEEVFQELEGVSVEGEVDLGLNQEQLDLFTSNIVSFPSEYTWMEISTGIGHWLGLLVTHDGDDIVVTRFDKFNQYVYCSLYSEIITPGPAGPIVVPLDPFGGNAKLEELESILTEVNSISLVAIRLCLSLYSRTTEVLEQTTPAGVNKKRRKRGKGELKNYNIVTIFTRDIIKKRHEAMGLTYTPKRWHSVRGHPKTLKNGKPAWIAKYWRGDQNLGIINKHYEVYRERIKKGESNG